MPESRLRFALGGLMRLIVALGLVLVRWGLGASVFILALLVGLSWLICRSKKTTRLRATLWVFTAVRPTASPANH